MIYLPHSKHSLNTCKWINCVALNFYLTCHPMPSWHRLQLTSFPSTYSECLASLWPCHAPFIFQTLWFKLSEAWTAEAKWLRLWVLGSNHLGIILSSATYLLGGLEWVIGLLSIWVLSPRRLDECLLSFRNKVFLLNLQLTEFQWWEKMQMLLV